MQASTPAWQGTPSASLTSRHGSLCSQVGLGLGLGLGLEAAQGLWCGLTCALPLEEELVHEAEAPEAKYTDIIIYTSGSLAVAMALIIVVLCRMQTLSSKQPLEPMAVHKLSKFPLIRQVRAELGAP